METECKILRTALYMEIFHLGKKKGKKPRIPKHSIFRVYVIIPILLKFHMSILLL